jgi:hypothetical protein
VLNKQTQQKQDKRNNFITMATTDDVKRSSAEAFIKQHFHRVHSAEIVSFMPYLVSIGRADIQACIGLRPATESLFIEHYLDLPLHQAHPALAIDRRRVIEVGNLVSQNRHSLLQLLVVISQALARASYLEMVFCATRQVADILIKIGADPHPIVDADPDRVGKTLGIWGSYYQNDPVVMRLNIASLVALIGDSPMLSKWADDYEAEINSLMESIEP